MTSNVHRDAQNEARRLIGQLAALLEHGEHLGAPSRSNHRIIIPIEQPGSDQGVDDTSMRALFAAWLDHSPSSE